jgi:hypothetical protein
MRTHITPTRIYTSDWEFARSYSPRRTAFGALLLIVALAVVAMVLWLIVNDPDTLRLTLVLVGTLALWLMAKGARR